MDKQDRGQLDEAEELMYEVAHGTGPPNTVSW